MIYRNDSLFERFNVLFGKKSSIVAGEEYPMGYFAAEALEGGRRTSCGIRKANPAGGRGI